MRHVAVGKRCGNIAALREFPPRSVCERPEGDDRFQRAGGKQCRKPAISISGHCRILGVRCGAALIIYAVKESVDHDIAAVDAQLCQKPLYSVTRDADQDTADNSLVLRGVLTDAQYSRSAVQSSAIEYRPPLRRGKRCKDRPTRPGLAHTGSQTVRGKSRDRTLWPFRECLILTRQSAPGRTTKND